MIRIAILVSLFISVSAYSVPNETCYDAPAYDCEVADFDLTENATICRTVATESLNWTHRIRCDGAPFYHCVMAKNLYNKEWKRFNCDDYNTGSNLQIACEKWKNVEYCEYNVVLTIFVTLIAAGILLILIYFIFMANKGNAKQEARDAYADDLIQKRKDKIIETGGFKPYKDNIRF